MDEMFDFAPKRDKLYKQVADQLQSLILADSIKPGDKLPSERELAGRMGVSRTVIREAIRVLSDRGLVRVKSGCGTYVRKLSPKDAAASIGLFLKLSQNPRLLQNVYEVRKMIEVEAAGMAAERATDEDRAALQAAIQSMADNQDDPKAYTKGDVAFHSALTTATHNELFDNLYDPISELLTEMIRISLDAPDAVQQGLTHHRNVLEQIERGDPQAARDAMKDHLARAKDLVEAAHNHMQAVSEETQE
jgi:GntR family transcriptional repressor for pyruvate dehydrogenase complex